MLQLADRTALHGVPLVSGLLDVRLNGWDCWLYLRDVLIWSKAGFVPLPHDIKGVWCVHEELLRVHRTERFSEAVVNSFTLALITGTVWLLDLAAAGLDCLLLLLRLSANLAHELGPPVDREQVRLEP